MSQHLSLSEDKIAAILTEGRFHFAFKCLEAVVRLNQNKNVVFSPYTIYEGLLLLYLASSDETETLLKQKLELPEDITQNEIKDWILNNIVNEQKKEKNLPHYKNKNKCWITNTTCVRKIMQYLFRGEFELIDFDRPYVNLKSRINELLRIMTEGYISKPIQLIHILKEMEIILLTILGVKGDIVNWYDSTNEYKMHSLKKPRTVMSESLKINVTEFPLINQNLSLFLLFPVDGFLNYLNRRDYGKMSEMINRLTAVEGVIELRKILDDQPNSSKIKTDKVTHPKFFELETDLEIEKLLGELGIQNLLEPNKGSLPNFADKNLQLGSAKHRAYIRTTSENVTAGAINMHFTLNKGSFNSPSDINCSAYRKKFLWLLYCRETRTILFMGFINVINSPTKVRRSFFHKFRRLLS